MNQETAQMEAVGTPDQKITRFEYDSYGQNNKIIKPDGVHLTSTYDEFGRLKTLTSSDQTIAYTYDYNNNHQVLKAQDQFSTTHRYYDTSGRLSTEILGNGLKMSYGYDEGNRITKVILPDASSIDYIYDAYYLKQVQRYKNGEQLYSHQYDKFDQSGNLTTSILIKNLGQIHTNYDLSQRPVSIESPSWSQKEIKYDTLGQITHFEIQDFEKTEHNFSYNAYNDLIAENNNQYKTDSIHNRLTKNDQNYKYNHLNQLTQKNDLEYIYDANGNLIRKGEHEYQYDALNRLIAVTTPETQVRYQYDPFDRRIAKVQFGNQIHYLYHDQNEIGSVIDGKIVELRILGLGIAAEIGSSIALELQDQIYTPIHDLQGNITCLIDATGQPCEYYRYSAFGEEEIFDASGQKLSTSAINNPWHYASKRLDLETGYIFFGRRYYEPETGRWITPDPLGFADGPNLYAYLHHNPLCSYDAYGCFDNDLNANDAEAYPSFGQYKTTITNTDINISWVPETNLPKIHYWDSFEDHFGTNTSYNHTGVPNQKDIGIGFINGIFNSENDLIKNVEHISKFVKGTEIDYVYNGSHRFTDIGECAIGLNYIATAPVRCLHQNWDSFFSRASDDAYYLQYCHSQGAIHVRNALLDYPPELRERILVVAIAPAAYIYEETCAKVIHYRAGIFRDFVPRLDIFGSMRSRDNTVTLKSHPKAKFFDHGFMSPTYQIKIREHLDTYINSGGQQL